MKISFIRNEVTLVFSFVSILLLWKIVSIVVAAEIILPSPESTFISLLGIVSENDFMYTILGSLGRMMIAFFIALVLSIVIGTVAGVNRMTDTIFKPYLHIIMATPVMSIILIAIIWFDKQVVPIFVSLLMGFPILCNNVISGVRNVDKKLIEMAKVYNVGMWRIFKEIYLPSMLPYILSGVRTSIGMGWKVIVVAEVLSQPKFSIGAKLYEAKIFLETPTLFAWTAVAVVLSFGCDKVTGLLEKRFTKWKQA